MTRPPEVIDGLAVRKDHTGWTVVHEASGLYVASSLRLRRFAEEARTEFLATGVDFTGSKSEVAREIQRCREVNAKWYARARQEELDLGTMEYYGHHSHYGQVIPSEAKVAVLCTVRDRLLAELEDGVVVRYPDQDRQTVLRALEAAGKVVHVPARGWMQPRYAPAEEDRITADSPADLGERGEELAREERADCSA